MIRLEKVIKYCGTGKNALHVLRDVDLEIAEGEFVSVTGSSGSGKSTLLSILGILDRYDQGGYYLDSRLVKGLKEREAARYRNRFIGFVLQAFNLLSFKLRAALIATLVLILSGALAGIVPARHAARISPVRALRGE